MRYVRNIDSIEHSTDQQPNINSSTSCHLTVSKNLDV